MRKKLTTYIEEDYIATLKRLALEQDNSVSDILEMLVKHHFECDITCISEFNRYLQTNKIQYQDKIFEFDRYEDLDYAVRFFKNNEEVCYIEHDFFEIHYKETLIEIIPIEVDDFVDINRKFIKKVK